MKFQNLAIARWMARLTTWNQEDSDEEGTRYPLGLGCLGEFQLASTSVSRMITVLQECYESHG